MNPYNKILVFNKQEWLHEPFFRFSEKEIDNANEKGYIGTRYGVDCYLTRRVSVDN